MMRCVHRHTASWMFMLARRLMALCLAAMMLSLLPPVAADDNIQSANPLTDGVTSNGYVCDPDCDAGKDKPVSYTHLTLPTKA